MNLAFDLGKQSLVINSKWDLVETKHSSKRSSSSSSAFLKHLDCVTVFPEGYRKVSGRFPEGYIAFVPDHPQSGRLFRRVWCNDCLTSSRTYVSSIQSALRPTCFGVPGRANTPFILVGGDLHVTLMTDCV